MVTFYRSPGPARTSGPEGEPDGIGVIPDIGTETSEAAGMFGRAAEAVLTGKGSQNWKFKSSILAPGDLRS